MPAGADITLDMYPEITSDDRPVHVCAGGRSRHHLAVDTPCAAHIPSRCHTERGEEFDSSPFVTRNRRKAVVVGESLVQSANRVEKNTH